MPLSAKVMRLEPATRCLRSGIGARLPRPRGMKRSGPTGMCAVLNFCPLFTCRAACGLAAA